MAPYIAFRVCYRRLLIPASVKESPGLPAAPPSPFQPLPPPSNFPPPPPPSPLPLPPEKKKKATLYQSRSSRPRWCAGRIFQRDPGDTSRSVGSQTLCAAVCLTGRGPVERWTVIGSEKGWLHGSVSREKERESR